MGVIAALVLAWLAFEVVCGVFWWLLQGVIERQDARDAQ